LREGVVGTLIVAALPFVLFFIISRIIPPFPSKEEREADAKEFS